MPTLTENTYVLAYFVITPHEDWDIFGVCTKEPDEDWLLDFRLRVYLDDKAHDSDDLKLWHQLKRPADTPEEEVTRWLGKHVHDLSAHMSKGTDRTLSTTYQLVQGNSEKLTTMLKEDQSGHFHSMEIPHDDDSEA